MREMGQSAWLITSYLPYRAQTKESMRGRQEPAVTTGYHGAIIILSGRPRTEDLEKLPVKARRHKTTPVQSSVSCLASCGATISAGENFEGPHVWPNGKTLLQYAQKDQTSHPPNPGAPRRALSQARPQRAITYYFTKGSLG